MYCGGCPSALEGSCGGVYIFMVCACMDHPLKPVCSPGSKSAHKEFKLSMCVSTSQVVPAPCQHCATHHPPIHPSTHLAPIVPQYHTALLQALHVIMHPVLILAGTINLDKSFHDFFHSHCHLPTPMIIMAHPLTSSNVASSLTSIHCVENYPVHPKEVHPHPSISTLHSMTLLLPSSHLYPPVPSMNNSNLPVIPIDPLYPPQ